MKTTEAEQALLAAIARHDEASRLVYADWLEGQGETERAEFLRLQQALVGTPPVDDAGKAVWKRRSDRLRVLADKLDQTWRTQVARPLVENCDAHFDFACPMEWGQLTPTDDPGVRSCKLCDEPVYYCTSIADARRQAFQKRCVAVDITVKRSANDLVQMKMRGRMVVTPRVVDED
jgi:uncharacterized protein (TIGR02996 family)